MEITAVNLSNPVDLQLRGSEAEMLLAIANYFVGDEDKTQEIVVNESPEGMEPVGFLERDLQEFAEDLQTKLIEAGVEVHVEKSPDEDD